MGAIAVFLILTANSANAGYDIYVDKNYDGSDYNGSSDKPYETISEAIEESGSGEKIYIKNGTYDETLDLKEGVDLYGQSKDKTIIKGSIESRGDNIIKNLTIAGKTYGIRALGKIEVEDCKVKNSSRIGIDLYPSGQSAKISNSIISGNEKGIYVQSKRSISISGNSIYGNRGEGLDIREKISGTVSGNEIYENGEGGIEMIVGGSDLKITDNSMKKNKASGIAAQFYSFIEKTGNISIQNNKIIRNGKFGFACGIPSGGAPSGTYWNESIELKENTIENNKIEAIDQACNVIQVVDEEEEKENKITENTDSKEAIEEAKEDAEIKEDIIQQKIGDSDVWNSKLIESSNEEMERMRNLSKLRIFFFGIRQNEFEILREKQGNIKNQIYSLENLKKETKNSENYYSIEKMIKTLTDEQEKINNFINDKETKFSLFGWALKLFKK